MPNTTNYSFPTPADTDLVKNGADAIRDLGDAVDTAMNTALGTKKAGMVLLNTTSFSGVASQAVTPIFSATYNSYRILVTISSNTVDGFLYIKLRSGATDASTNYDYALNYTGTNSANLPDGGTGQTNGMVMSTIDAGLTDVCFFSIDMNNPFAAKITSANFTSTTTFQTGVKQNVVGSNWHTTAASYDGINIISSAGTITGRVQIYGYNQ
jgi:hypothetical protein